MTTIYWQLECNRHRRAYAARLPRTRGKEDLNPAETNSNVEVPLRVLFFHSQIPASSVRYADQVDNLLISGEDLSIGYWRDAFLLDAWSSALGRWPESLRLRSGRYTSAKI